MAPAMPPPFAGIRVCATPGCGAHLSRFNPRDVCAQCEQREAETETATFAGGIDLEKLVAGLLLTHEALHPGEPLHVIAELERLGIEADCWTVRNVIRHIASRHGLVARGVRGRPGYAVVEWQRRYQPVVGFGGTMMERDPDSGRYSGTVALAVAAAEEAAEGRHLQPSLPGFERGFSER